MKPSERREKRIKLFLLAAVLAIFGIYVGQGAIIHLRLHLLDATPLHLNLQSEGCDQTDCTAEWLLTPPNRFLLLGHIMRTHVLTSAETGLQIFPVSRVRGITADSWSGLRVYQVEPNTTYRLVAKKPKAVKMGYFVGVMPRSTNNEGVLSVPDISPTASTIASMLGFGVLSLLLVAAFLAPTTGVDASKKREELLAVGLSSLAAIIVSAISTGLVDSLLPDGELRSRILRSALIASIALPPVQRWLNRLTSSIHLRLILPVLGSCLIINFNWWFFRAGLGHVVTLSTVVAMLALWLYRSGHKGAALVVILGFYDSFKVAGLVSIPDDPPIYVVHFVLIAAYSLVVGDLGAVSVIGLAAKAYQGFTRDISLSQIASMLDQSATKPEANDLSNAVKGILPRISQLTGAGRVSILVNLPFARPITHSYTTVDGSTVTHDDGKIPGAVTVRAFVFGDEAWFERYHDFANRLSIARSKAIENAEYVCIAPIRVNQANTGVLMLTSFDDAHIDRLIESGRIDDEKETARMVVETLASKFSDVVIHSMKSNTTLSADLLGKIREAIPASGSTQEFLDRYCEAIFEVTGMRTMLHEWQGDAGVGVAQGGFLPEEWRHFAEAPFNLRPSAKKAFGSTVVAFIEKKASYIKDWFEIQDKLHPKTVDILAGIDVCSFLAVPMNSGSSRFVVTMLSRRNEPPRDPGLMHIIESTEAVFDAAVTVFGQRTSVLALGKLANRLIGDDEVRLQIIEAAKQESLQTTIGTPRTSFLLLFDLAGSSNLPGDTEEKARSYGFFYDEVNKICQHLLGGKVRKTIGDAVIITWDGTNSRLEDHSDVPGSLASVVAVAESVARKVGCGGVRAVLHHGDYFFGLIGTSSFGQIDVIGKGIDEVCKMESAMKTQIVNGRKPKIAISYAAIARLPNATITQYQESQFIELSKNSASEENRGNDIAWVCMNLRETDDVIDLNSAS